MSDATIVIETDSAAVSVSLTIEATLFSNSVIDRLLIDPAVCQQNRVAY